MKPQHSATYSYRSADVYGGAENTNPHHLVEMLFDGLLEKLGQANVGMKSSDTGMKCNAINKALNILDMLRTALNFDQGGNLATNLDDLYDYMQRRLVIANRDSDTTVLKEVHGLVGDIRLAWNAIPEEERIATTE